MRVGVHCSVRNGFAAALDEARRLDCDTLQLFTQSPRGWKTRVYTDEEFAEFRDRKQALHLHPVVVHSPYLPNLGTSDESLYERSCRTLQDDLMRAEKLGADFLVIHPGAYSPQSNYAYGLKRICGALRDALERGPGRVRILIENVAGGGRRIGGTFRELAEILNGVGRPDRTGVCFDTCHATGAGIALQTAAQVRTMLKDFDRTVGLDKIYVFHVNDSKGAVGSHRDLHEHIGKGHVGLAGFRALFSEPAFRNCALILETPKDAPRADLKNLKTLRSLLPPPSFPPPNRGR